VERRIFIVVGAVCTTTLMLTCSGGGGVPTPDSIISENLEIILNYGGIPAVILLFGYLYLRSLMKEYGRQLRQMQEQLNNQQVAMNVLIQNNTKALTRLGTAMMMGCPFIKSQIDPNAIDCGDGDGGEG